MWFARSNGCDFGWFDSLVATRSTVPDFAGEFFANPTTERYTQPADMRFSFATRKEMVWTSNGYAYMPRGTVNLGET